MSNEDSQPVQTEEPVPKLNLSEFQAKSAVTACYPQWLKVIYPSLGLAGEAGEVVNKIKKIYRDDKELTQEVKDQIGREIFDVMWYCSALATDLELDLNDIANNGFKKLSNRNKNGTIKGDGDDR